MPRFVSRVDRYPWTWRDRLGMLRNVILGRPRYKDYYPHTEPMRLPMDPRAQRRAEGKGFFFSLPILPIGWTLSNYAEFAAFHFDKRIDPHLGDISAIFNPGTPLFLAAALFAKYHYAPAYERWIHHNLMISVWGFLITAGLFTAVMSFITASNVLDTSDLSEEHGNSRWIHPEELQALNLLPPNYSVFTGFASGEHRRVKRDRAALSVYQTAINRAKGDQQRAESSTPVTVSVAQSLSPAPSPSTPSETPPAEAPASASAGGTFTIPSILGGAP